MPRCDRPLLGEIRFIEKKSSPVDPHSLYCRKGRRSRGHQPRCDRPLPTKFTLLGEIRFIEKKARQLTPTHYTAAKADGLEGKCRAAIDPCSGKYVS